MTDRDVKAASLYGLIGKPLGHSRSPELVNGFFTERGIDAYYSLYPLDDISGLMSLLRENQSIKGLNVTIPYKEKIMPLLASLTPEAEKTGAVNCIAVERRDGEILLYGHNTDMEGFRDALLKVMNEHDVKISDPSDQTHALVLGTGGASMAVKTALDSLGIQVTFVSRTAKGENIINYTEITPEIISGSQIIVNATPLGTFPGIESYPLIDYRAITPGTIAFDLVYNPPLTRFMSLSRSRGAIVSNGLEMLRLQALASLRFWGIEGS